MRKILIFLMLFALSSGVFMTTASAYSYTYFSDVPVDHWARNEITALTERGVIHGYGDGKMGHWQSVGRSKKQVTVIIMLFHRQVANISMLAVATQQMEQISKSMMAIQPWRKNG
ncbi:MAG: S-layer homology domain-containing protein, partial [Oscillospiraceae bacterium]|nr:S-layer homology domain-containing protein [Oscillospiraceae bacterium]